MSSSVMRPTFRPPVGGDSSAFEARADPAPGNGADPAPEMLSVSSGSVSGAGMGGRVCRVGGGAPQDLWWARGRYRQAHRGGSGRRRPDELHRPREADRAVDLGGAPAG